VYILYIGKYPHPGRFEGTVLKRGNKKGGQFERTARKMKDKRKIEV
jgi:hypothetical protein